VNGSADHLAQVLPAAAMEPWAERRDDSRIRMLFFSQVMRQWSPPVSGRTTLMTARRSVRCFSRPQWSRR
jgi:hypothetical protein